MLRATYYSQELLTTFRDGTISEIVLRPRFEDPGGVFLVTCNERTIWDRKGQCDEGFPETKILKQRVRDIVDPDRGLGHSDATPPPPTVDKFAVEEEEEKAARDERNKVWGQQQGPMDPAVAKQLEELQYYMSLGRDKAVAELERQERDGELGSSHSSQKK